MRLCTQLWGCFSCRGKLSALSDMLSSNMAAKLVWLHGFDFMRYLTVCLCVCLQSVSGHRADEAVEMLKTFYKQENPNGGHRTSFLFFFAPLYFHFFVSLCLFLVPSGVVLVIFHSFPRLNLKSLSSLHFCWSLICEALFHPVWKSALSINFFIILFLSSSKCYIILGLCFSLDLFLSSLKSGLFFVFFLLRC